MGSREVVVQLDPGEPISGSLKLEQQAPISFTGWMELVALLETARARESDGAPE